MLVRIQLLLLEVVIAENGPVLILPVAIIIMEAEIGNEKIILLLILEKLIIIDLFVDAQFVNHQILECNLAVVVEEMLLPSNLL